MKLIFSEIRGIINLFQIVTQTLQYLSIIKYSQNRCVTKVSDQKCYSMMSLSMMGRYLGIEMSSS